MGVAALAVVGFVGSYYTWFRYEPKALGHVPSDAAWITRLDVETHALFAPFRRQFLPALNALRPATDPSEAEDAGLLREIRESTGLNLGLDLRELVFASDPTGARWVLLAGGLFRYDPQTATRLAALLAKLGHPSFAGPAGTSVWKGGLTLGQLSDGVVLLASSPALYAEVAEGTSVAQRLGSHTLSPWWVSANLQALARRVGEPRFSDGKRFGDGKLEARLYQQARPRLQLIFEGAPGASLPGQAVLLVWAKQVFALLGLEVTPAEAPGGERADSAHITVWLEWSEQATEQLLGRAAQSLEALVRRSEQTNGPN